MNFRIEPDPRYPLGGHALLVLPEGASFGTGRFRLRRLYDNWYLGPHGWQAAEVTLGPIPASQRDSGYAVALGPAVVDHLEEFTNLEITFEEGASGEVVWPENVLPSPDRAGHGGLRSAEMEGAVLPAGREPLRPAAGPEPAAPKPRLPDPDPVPPDPAAPPPKPEPNQTTRKRSSVGWWIGGLIVLAAAGAYLYLNADQFLDRLNDTENSLEACSEAAFVADQDSDPATQLDRVRRCAGTDRVSPEVLLAAVERVLDRSPEALVIMGRWYDPAFHETEFSPFDAPAIESATRYYFEAKGAGVAEADALLRDACVRLDSSKLMQDSARQLYCPEG